MISHFDDQNNFGRLIFYSNNTDFSIIGFLIFAIIFISLIIILFFVNSIKYLPSINKVTDNIFTIKNNIEKLSDSNNNSDNNNNNSNKINNNNFISVSITFAYNNNNNNNNSSNSNTALVS